MKTADALTLSGFREIQVAFCNCQAALIRSTIKGRQALPMATKLSLFSFLPLLLIYTFLGCTRNTNQMAAHLSQFRPSSVVLDLFCREHKQGKTNKQERIKQDELNFLLA